MALDDFEQDDPYRTRVNDSLSPIGSGGIAGPQDFPAPVSAPAPAPKTGGYDLEQFRNSWYGKGDVNNPQGWLDQNRDFTDGVSLVNGHKAYRNGQFIADLVGNAHQPGQQRSAIFLDGVGSNGQPRSAAPSGRGMRPGNAQGMGQGQAPAPAANNFLTQIRQLITDRLGKMSGEPSMNDPALKAQSDAYRVSRTRGAEDARAAMAERAAANGTIQGGQSSGSFDTELRSIHEAKGEDIAGNDAQLLGRESLARRNEVQSLLNMALQSGDAETARALQMQLAQMDAALRREGMAQQNSQFNANLNQQGSQFNDQFGRQLGRDYESDYMTRVMLGLGA